MFRSTVHPFATVTHRVCASAPPGDDLLDDLPPMDGDDEDDVPVQAYDTDQLSAFDAIEGEEDDGAADATLPIGDLIDTLPDAPDTAPEAGGDADVDTGDGGIAFSDELVDRSDDDAEGIPDDDASTGIDSLVALGEDDEHDGTEEPLENEIDESAYPELDLDEDGDLPVGLDVGEVDLPDEVPLPEWSHLRWERVDTPLVAVPMRWVTCGPSHVAAAGDGVVLISIGSEAPASCHFLPLDGHDGAELIGVGLTDAEKGELVFASRQRLMISIEGGKRVRRVADVHDDGPNAGLVHLGMSSATFAYASTLQGKLLVSADRGCTWRTIVGVGAVRALTVDEQGAAHVLASQDDQLHWLQSDEGGRWQSKILQGPPLELRLAPSPSIAVRGRTLALATQGGELTASLDAGDSWTKVRLPSQLRSVTVVPDDQGDMIVGAFYAESEDRSYLFAWRPGSNPSLVGDLSPDVAVGSADVDTSEGLGRAHHVVWDPVRGCVWVAGTFGLCAWRPKLPT